MATRPIRYELHIRPLFRLIDRDNMSGAFDLWDYDQAKLNADAILLRIAADMPPIPYGGPWPAEWIATFQRWKDEGYLRLDLGAVDPSEYTARRSGESVTLTCRGKTPSNGYRAWLEAALSEGQPRESTLYWEPPVPALPPSPSLFRARATFPSPPSVTTIIVSDAGGRYVVPITVAPPPLAFVGPLAQVQPALESIGARHIETTPMIGGSVGRYQLGDAEIIVFSDGHGFDIDAPPALYDVIRAGIAPAVKSKNTK